jgi:hypothetical protein
LSMVCSVASKRIAETPVRRFIDSLYRRDYASAGPRTGGQAQGSDDHSTDDGQEDHLVHLVHMCAGEWASLRLAPHLVFFGTHAGSSPASWLRSPVRPCVQAGWGVRCIFRLGSYRTILGLWMRLPGSASGTTGPAGT